MGNTCSSVSNTVPRQFAFTVLFPKRNELDENKMKLVTNIINAENSQSGRFNLSESKQRAIQWYNSCSEIVSKKEVEARIKKLETLGIQLSDLKAYGRYLKYRVDMHVRTDSTTFNVTTLDHRATI